MRSQGAIQAIQEDLTTGQLYYMHIIGLVLIALNLILFCSPSFFRIEVYSVSKFILSRNKFLSDLNQSDELWILHFIFCFYNSSLNEK